jgi:hypothetical protein
MYFVIFFQVLVPGSPPHTEWDGDIAFVTQ